MERFLTAGKWRQPDARVCVKETKFYQSEEFKYANQGLMETPSICIPWNKIANYSIKAFPGRDLGKVEINLNEKCRSMKKSVEPFREAANLSKKKHLISITAAIRTF